jgi:two-component system, NarL family, response regulator DevR
MKEGSNMSKIKLLIVEDDADWITALTSFLEKENDIDIVATVSDKENALKVIKENAIDIILMDINLTGNKCDGIFATSEICLNYKIKIIMLTNLNEEKLIIDSYTAGAVNFILKSNHYDILPAIRLAYNKESSLEILLKEYLRLKEEEQLKVLTSAEKEILKLVNEGYTHTQIQKKLYKSESTIKNQINKLLKKLDSSSMKEAIKKVKMKGLFEK